MAIYRAEYVDEQGNRVASMNIEAINRKEALTRAQLYKGHILKIQNVDNVRTFVKRITLRK